MISFGALLLFTVIIVIKLMQQVRVSVVMGVLSGLLIVATTSYVNGMDYIGFVLVILGIGMLLKK
jgi:hypothetical protein